MTESACFAARLPWRERVDHLLLITLTLHSDVVHAIYPKIQANCLFHNYGFPDSNPGAGCTVAS